jgi:hypothetical protein
MRNVLQGRVRRIGGFGGDPRSPEREFSAGGLKIKNRNRRQVLLLFFLIKM